MSYDPRNMYSPYTKPGEGEGGASYAYTDYYPFTYYNPNDANRYSYSLVVQIDRTSYTEYINWYESSDFYKGTMFAATPSYAGWGYTTYEAVCAINKKVYCDFNTSINMNETLLLPVTVNGDTIEVGTGDSGELLPDRWFLYQSNNSKYEGYPIVAPCIGINNSCEDVIGMEDNVKGFKISKNTNYYSVPRKYWNYEKTYSNILRIGNTGSADRLVTITRNGSVFETITVSAGDTVWYNLDVFNINDKISLTSQEIKSNVKIKTAAATFSDAKKVYVKTADATFTEAKAVYLKTSDTEWKQVM